MNTISKAKSKLYNFIHNINPGFTIYLSNNLLAFDFWNDEDKLNLIMYLYREGFLDKEDVDELKEELIKKEKL